MRRHADIQVNKEDRRDHVLIDLIEKGKKKTKGQLLKELTICPTPSLNGGTEEKKTGGYLIG